MPYRLQIAITSRGDMTAVIGGWRKYIRDTFHVDYMTFMRWLREERADTTPPAFSDRTLFD